jgi:ATP-binding cassette subfamily B protein/subfamily B ATP-binding cassette protein MsbA
LIAFPLMLLAMWRLTPRLVDRSIAQANIEGSLWSELEQTLSATPVVQTFNGEDREAARFDRTTDQLLAAHVASTRAQLAFKVAVGGAAAVVTALVLWVAARHVVSGRLTLGSLLVFLAYLQAFYSPLDTLVSSQSTVGGVAGSVRRIVEVMTTQPDVHDRPGARRLRRVVGHVSFEGVAYEYEAGRRALQDVSFSIEPGQTAAFVGPSGAGKTTLVSLVPRFIDPVQGRVRIDGRDVRDVRLVGLRSSISIVLQEPFLFPISIGDNIAYGRPRAHRERIEEAARAANAHEFIMSLPDGYDTVVGERGATLSGGQRQRVSIARALLRDAPILILDEPTSALDPDSEHLLLEALDRLREGRTTLMIAHRQSTIRDADLIVVMDGGRVVETGTHDELMARAGSYAGMWLTAPAARASGRT